MPAPIVGALCLFIGEELSVSVWDGEIPRTDNSGNPINPDSTVVPSNWPVVKLWMVEPGFDRDWNVGTDPYSDAGQVLVQMWATSKVQTQALMDSIESLLASEANWRAASDNLGGPAENPSYFIKIMLKRFWLGDEKGQRTSKSELLYRGDMLYDIFVHGAVSTQ